MDAVHDLFEFEDVTLVRGGRTLLEHVSTAFSRHGITVIVGPSGSGKTTLLRLCNRLEIPDGGRVLYGGTDVAEIPATRLRRSVGMVFQRPTMFDGTLRDNLAVAAPDHDDEEYATQLRRVGLDPTWLEHAAGDLSGGEMQRLCIARALETEPDILLMDEPTSSLDAEAKAGIEDLARELSGDGMPMIWVTHDTHQVERLGDHVFRLAEGSLRIEGEHHV